MRMRKRLISLRMYLTVAAMLIAAGLLLIQRQPISIASTASPQGKGGTIKSVPTPTPAPKKATPKKGAPASNRVNTKPNQSTQSKEDEAAATERTYWETISNSTDPEDFRVYLKRYPNGVYADLANNRIKALEAAKTQPLPTATPTPAATPEPVASPTATPTPQTAAPVTQPAPPHTSLKVGQAAPDFTLPSTSTGADGRGLRFKLSDFKGKKNVVLAFYVLAFTGG
jgi:hypothetical protein